MRKIMLSVLIFVSFISFCNIAYAAFVVKGDGTVCDTLTGLIWQQATAGPMTWENALTYCETLSLGGHDDWRLPDRNELQSIVDYSTYDPAIDTTAFTGTMPSSYWSSTTNAYDPDRAWIVDFDDGYVYYGVHKSSSYYVRAVRSGQCGSFDDSVISQNLTPGYTLMAAPLSPLTDICGNVITPTATELIRDIPKCVQIIGWDEVNQQWRSIIKSGDMVVGTDFDIEPERGYLLQTTEPVSYPFTGFEITEKIVPTPETLTDGFNLVRIKDPNQSYTSHQILQQIPGARQIFSLDTETQSWVSNVKATDTVIIGEEFPIDENRGYIIQYMTP